MPLWDFSNSQFDNNRSINKNTYFIDITETYQRCETRSLLFRLIQWHFIANNTWNLKIFMSSFLFLPFFTHIFLSIYLSTLAVRVKQEHRNDLDSPAVSPMSMPLVHAASLVCAQPLSSPEHSHPPDGLLSSSPRGLAAGLHPLQAPCAPMGSPLFPTCPTFRLKGWMHLPNARCPSIRAMLPLPGHLTLTYSTTCPSTASTVFLWLWVPHRHTSECPSRPTLLGVTPWVWGWCMDRLLWHPPLECLRGLAPSLAMQPVQVATRSWSTLPLTFTL